MIDNGRSPKTADSYNMAIGALGQATQLDPNNSYAWHYLGDAYLGLANVLPGNPAYQLELYKKSHYAYGNSKLLESNAPRASLAQYK